MESNPIDQVSFTNEQAPARPEFLKIICILSFICCGLMILIYTLGTFTLALNEDTIGGFWDNVVQSNPQLKDLDPIEFFHQVGMVCLDCLVANIFSLVGVIMMWRLEKLGFVIYTIAEIVPYFLSVDMGVEQGNSWMGTAIVIAVDLVFIGMYAANLKHMGKKNAGLAA